MLEIIFDVPRIKTKILITIMIITVFSVIYMVIPKNEFHKFEYEKFTEKEITYFDIMQYSIMSQVGIHGLVLYPKSFRARMATIIQLFLGYVVLLM